MSGRKKSLHFHKKTIVFAALLIAMTAVAGLWMARQNRSCHIVIPTYDQYEYGYPKGCEGVSLYMALKGKGYLETLSLEAFMDTMPKSESDPELGYVGDPTEEKTSAENKGKRTTINPSPLAAWGASYGNVVSLEGADVAQLKKELRSGNPLVVYVTAGWKEAKWGSWDWGDAVTNNHAVCLVGYDDSTGEYLINDCGTHNGEYWVEASVFENSYNARHYAVVVR